MKHLRRCAVLFVVGGILYMGIELVWRGRTYLSMGILGGLLSVLIGGINEFFPWSMPLALQCVIGAVMATAAEFFAGLLLNVWLGLGIWDYGRMPGNVMGQICPQFSAAWLGLALVAIVLDDWLRYWLWGEERPHYNIFGGV